MILHTHDYTALISMALAEDIGNGDLTSRALIPEERMGRAKIIAKESLVVCGQEIAKNVFSAVDPGVSYTALLRDGAPASPGSALGEASGPLRSILTAERTVLNFLQRLSGISTLAARIVAQVQDLPVKILDTRKTTPGWRKLEKYAVRMGGATNHRQGLFDAVLVKNNHIDAIGGDVGKAVSLCRGSAPRGVEITVEVRNRAELESAVAAQPDVILLDNMKPEAMREAVEFIRSHSAAKPIRSEASGGINESNVRECAATGVDRLSLGILTHSARAVDISLSYSG